MTLSSAAETSATSEISGNLIKNSSEYVREMINNFGSTNKTTQLCSIGGGLLGSLFMLRWIVGVSKKSKEKKKEIERIFKEIQQDCRQQVNELVKKENVLSKKQKIGVLIVNLGTPSQATHHYVYRYLSQFLMDGRVIDVSYLLRFLLVRGIIVPFRYKRSTRFYQEIWKNKDYSNSECSPLKYNTTSLVSKVSENLKGLNDDNCEFQVEMAMRYQEPSIESGLKKLEGCAHIVVVPLFPQYASATTGSTHEECMRVVMKWLTIPSLHFNSTFNLMDMFIKSNVKRIQEALQRTKTERENQPFDHLLLTYHSLPVRHVTQEFQEKKSLQYSYYQQSFETSVAILKELFNCTAEELIQDETNVGWFTYKRSQSDSSDDYSSNFTPTLQISTCFQSRLGKEPWLEPYTSKTLGLLAKQSSRVLIACPSFTSDCIETDHELEIEEKEEFYLKGGKYMAVARCVNDDDLFANGLTDLIAKYKQVV